MASCHLGYPQESTTSIWPRALTSDETVFYKKALSNPNKDSIVIIRARVNGYKNELAILDTQMSEFNKGMATVEVLGEIQGESSQQLGEDKERYKQIKSAYSSYFPTVHTVEEAETPVVKSRPKRSKLVILAGALSFFFISMAVILIESYKEINWKEVLNGK